jgi:hypothetical protein
MRARWVTKRVDRGLPGRRARSRRGEAHHRHHRPHHRLGRDSRRTVHPRRARIRQPRRRSHRKPAPFRTIRLGIQHRHRWGSERHPITTSSYARPHKEDIGPPDTPLNDQKPAWMTAGRGVHTQEKRTPRRAISGPFAPVNSGQSRSPPDNEPPSSAALTAGCNTPSKLVMRVRFPSSAP